MSAKACPGYLVHPHKTLVTTDTASLAIGALLVLGLGVAGIFPTVVGEAGTLVPGKSGALTGVLMTTYVCFLLAPLVIGWVAEWSSLRIALALVGLCGLSIVWFAWRLHHLPSAVS